MKCGRVIITRTEAMFCTSFAVQVHLGPPTKTSHTQNRPKTVVTGDDSSLYKQYKLRQSLQSCRSLVELTVRKDLRHNPVARPSNLPCIAPSASTQRSKSARKMTSCADPLAPDPKKRMLLHADTMPVSTAWNNAPPGQKADTLPVFVKILSIGIKAWLRMFTRTQKVPLFHAPDGRSRGGGADHGRCRAFDTMVPACSDHVLGAPQDVDREGALQYACCLLQPKTTAELQNELMLLFRDAIECGCVVESHWQNNVYSCAVKSVCVYRLPVLRIQRRWNWHNGLATRSTVAECA